MNTLSDLRQHRQVAWLWRHALTLDHVGVDRLVQDRSAHRCYGDHSDRPAPRPPRVSAERGDDGRVHLWYDGELRCGRPTDAGVWSHRAKLWWWADGTTYRWRSPSDPTDWWYDETTVEFDVRLAGQGALDPTRVPRRDRCGDDVLWPLYRDSATALGRVRIALLDTFGIGCTCCHRSLGREVDHDHFTGAVRGLLCQTCNSHVDRCPHTGQCRYADYLNNPPATQLGLVYPVPPSKYLRSLDRATIERLGINPFIDPLLDRAPNVGKRPAQRLTALPIRQQKPWSRA
jgi:hypothetical protein